MGATGQNNRSLIAAASRMTIKSYFDKVAAEAAA
jgi:hypothetical protein